MDLRQLAAWAPYERVIGGMRVPLGRGDVLISVRQAAARWQWSPGRTQRFLRILIAMRYLVRRERTGDGDIYHVEAEETSGWQRYSGEHGGEHTVETAMDTPVDTPMDTLVDTREKKIEEGEKQQQQGFWEEAGAPLVKGSSWSGEDGDFDEWFGAYPAHRREARPRARLAWDETAAQRPALAEMLAILAVQERSYRWRAEGGKYVPAAWNYLLQARWADDGSAYPGVELAAAAAPAGFDVPERVTCLAAALPPALPGRETWTARITALAGEATAVEEQLEALDLELM
ncbi:MAG TPA: hypothetical protein VJA16_10470, partial [Thermoanaerobaculia bacterium]